jgi:hypothetical protein
MSLPRDPGLDLSLEGLGDRDGQRPAPFGETALVGQSLAPHSIQRDFRTAYEALVDAVFSAPGATEWLAGLRRAVATMLASKNEGVRLPRQHDAIRPTEPYPGRS